MLMTKPADVVLESGKKARDWYLLGAAFALGAVILLLQPPAGLTRIAQSVLAIAASAILLWVFHVMDNGVVSVLMMALMILAGVPPATALSGFSTPQFWILLAVLYYGFAMQSTGLAKRLSFYILNLFPPTYAGVLSAFFVIGLVLALGVPSMTVRTAIMVPIAWALVQAIGLAPRSRECALIVLSSIEMAVVPGCAFLYGSLWGPVVESLFRAKQLELTWLGYAQVLTVPTLLLSVLLLSGNWMALRPVAALSIPKGLVQKQLAALGPIRKTELITGGVVLFSIAYWATDRLHHLPGFAIGMIALAVFAMTGILRDKDVGTGVPWSLLLFLGGIFSLANVIQQQQITDWLASVLVPLAQQFLFSPLVFVLAMAVAMLLMKFLDPTGFIALAVLFLPISTVAIAADIPPLVVTAALVLAGMPLWASYQNIWVAMGEGITAGQAFSSSQRIRIAHAYAIVTVVSLITAVGFWTAIGIL